MSRKIIYRISAVISGISGLIILIGVLYPIFSYDSIYSSRFQKLISPVNENLPGFSTQNAFDDTQASNWFPSGASKDEFSSSKVEYYTISIPKLRIDNATVAIGGEDLSKSLIQYPGTALPGKRGNSVIFGHSILPIFYNPKEYISIFSLLPTLKVGDDIYVNYDGVSYRYQVETMFEVRPTDIQVLDQDISDSFLTLVTCTPPGDPTKPKRLIVKARVVLPE